MTDTAVAATETAAPTAAQKFSAEVLGTFVLVFFGVGAALATGADVITTGLAFGLTVLVMAYSVGRVSGGHFNPAVTVGAAVGGRLAWSHVPLYIVAQLLGAVAGAAVLWSVYQGIPGFSSEGSFGQNSFGDLSAYDLGWWAAFLVEAVTTLVFLMAILAVTDERNEHPALAPLAIGLTLAMIHFATIPLTGTSVNPARSIGPALFAGVDAIAQLWLFILATLLGGALAGLLYPLVFGRHGEPVAGSGLRFGRRPPPGAVPGYGAPDAYQQQWNQQYGVAQPGQPGQAPWPPQPPQQWQQPQYPTAPPPQSWPQQPPQASPPQWPAGDDDGQTQVRPPT
jgi:aquaporin Z